jgi:hypothetical protein
MSGSIPPLSQYALMVWCSVKAQGHLYLYTRVYPKVSGLAAWSSVPLGAVVSLFCESA